MTTYYHLYDAASDTHYQNGGYIQPDSEAPAEGLEWVVGYPPDGSLPWEPPASLSKRIETIFLGIGGSVLSSPSPEALASLKAIMEVDTFLSAINKRFGDGPAYAQAAFSAVSGLGELSGELETGRQLILAEISKEL